ncbi:MAG: inositol monophosphatase family protein [Rhodospirillales bacterium]|jgi:myo-inositol-1(or 4)-monophosphatase|nr:inositol monophosphatase family protein [Rhodospirillales bacterium]
MANTSALINVMTAAARKAARHLVRDFGEVENLQVSRKGPADFVSTADKKSESILHGELKKARPGYGFLMEEGGVIEGSDSSNTWIIDPLDGTTNFLHGIPFFAISIALERDRDLFAGVIYEPITDQMFWAEKGQGAHLNGRRLRVSARRELADSLFATGIPFKGSLADDGFVRQLDAVMRKSAGVRRLGSASLDMAYVAAGRFEGYWETGINAWDIAAGVVLVREAGGFVTEIDGGKDFLANRNVVAANPSMHAPLSTLLRATTGTAD